VSGSNLESFSLKNIIDNKIMWLHSLYFSFMYDEDNLLPYRSSHNFCLLFQMTCVRLLETLPVIYDRLNLSKSSGNMLHAVPTSSDFQWLSDLADWGGSHLVVVIRHWKQCMQLLLNIFKVSFSDSTSSMICTIEKVISAG